MVKGGKYGFENIFKQIHKRLKGAISKGGLKRGHDWVDLGLNVQWGLKFFWKQEKKQQRKVCNFLRG